MELNHYVGIDVSKLTLDFSVCENGTIIFRISTENNKKGISKAVKQFRLLKDFSMKHSVFCMEHTGIYNYHLLDYLQSSKSLIWLESAMRIKKSQGLTRGKDDKMDADRIAKYCHTYRKKMQLWQPPREEIRNLKHLLTIRERLVKGIKQLATPKEENALFINQKMSKLEKKIVQRSLKAMEKDLEAVEELIQQQIDKDVYLMTIPVILTRAFRHVDPSLF